MDPERRLLALRIVLVVTALACLALEPLMLDEDEKEHYDRAYWPATLTPNTHPAAKELHALARAALRVDTVASMLEQGRLAPTARGDFDASVVAGSAFSDSPRCNAVFRPFQPSPVFQYQR